MDTIKTILTMFGVVCVLGAVGAGVAVSLHGQMAFADPATKADQMYDAELKKEVNPKPKRRLEYLSDSDVRFFCLDGTVYVMIGHTTVRYFRNNSVVACTDF